MRYGELLTDDAAFSELCAECNAVFDTNQRLPGKVFRPNFAKYYAFEHGQIFQKNFATFLSCIAGVFDDTAVNYMTLDPHPVEYYWKNCGFYGLASFKPSSLMDSYLKVMSREGNADSFRARGGDIGVLWGSSKNWGIFCDRVSWDVCLMGTSFELDDFILNEVGCMDADRLKLHLLHQYQNRHVVAVEFLKKLDATYPALRYQH